MQVKQLQMMVYSSLMAALIAVGAYLHIPVGPVPIVLQNLFVLLAALLLGGRWALIAMSIYLLVGAMGIPVFAGAKGGLAHFMGPTGGYLAGFAVCAFVTGTISERSNGSLAVNAIAVVVGSLLVYAFGVPWLKLVTGMSWAKAATVGMLPFLIGDAIKATSAVLLARAVRPLVWRQIQTVSAS